MQFNAEVRSYWEQETCGTSERVVGDAAFRTPEWFAEIERFRYEAEPFIHDIAQFPKHHGKTMLEVGVGAGTDHLQWARAGCQCHGVDLTDAGIETTRAHLALHGFTSNLRRLDAETLPFDAGQFDLVYSWGVIHHSEHPEQIIREIHRVLKPGGVFIGMMYGRLSVSSLRLWTEYALLRGHPSRTLSEVLSAHMESAGTKAYTVAELRSLCSSFSAFTAKPLLTPWERRGWPRWITRFFPDHWGFFIAFNCVK